MKHPLAIALAVTLVLAAGFFLIPSPRDSATLTDLPWQVERHPDGTSTVFGITLGSAPLREAQEKFGVAEGIALFVSPDGEKSLEAYFGNVTLGPLRAKIIATVQADAEQLERWSGLARDRQATRSGAAKLVLPDRLKAAALEYPLASLTYIPAYAGLDEQAIEGYFGSPARRQRVDAGTVQWFYPDIGVDVLIDADGKEVFQYRPPRDFPDPDPQVVIPGS